MSNDLKAFKEIKRHFESLEGQDATVKMNLDTLRGLMKRNHGTKRDDTDKAVEFLRDNNIVEMYWEGVFWITPGRQWGVWEPK